MNINFRRLMSGKIAVISSVLASALLIAPITSANAAGGNAKVATVSSPPLFAEQSAPKSEAASQIACETTGISEVSGIAFSSTATRIKDTDTVEALVKPLRQLAAVQGASIGSVEVLGWGAGGEDKAFPAIRAQQVMGELKNALQTTGFAYAIPTATRQDGDTSVTLLTAVRTGENKGQKLIGFWIKTDHALLLVWGTVEPVMSTQPAKSNMGKQYNPQITMVSTKVTTPSI